jgi:hypothetical protein
MLGDPLEELPRLDLAQHAVHVERVRHGPR